MVSERRRKPRISEGPVPFPLSDDRAWKPVVDARRIFLFLDLDGTLAEIRAHPREVALSPERRRCLEGLAAAPWIRVAVVSGRTVEDLQKRIGPGKVFYVGNHGLVIVTPRGRRLMDPGAENLVAQVASLRRSLRRCLRDVPGIVLEDKRFSLALHFRLVERELKRKAVEEFVRALDKHRDEGCTLEILHGKEMIEAKPVGVHKGKAVADLLDRYGVGAVPIYIGDDLTDETAFRALRHRGVTILVAESPRPTAAAYYLRNPGEVYSFLRRLIAVRAERRG